MLIEIIYGILTGRVVQTATRDRKIRLQLRFVMDRSLEAQRHLKFRSKWTGKKFFEAKSCAGI